MGCSYSALLNVLGRWLQSQTHQLLNRLLQVFKATWQGTVVAVKIMVLPSYMTGKEKREKMAVMETAISSSLSHPNCVQTYTYAVEPVRSNTALDDRSHPAGCGASITMHDSTRSWDENPARDSEQQGSGKDSNTGEARPCEIIWHK